MHTVLWIIAGIVLGGVIFFCSQSVCKKIQHYLDHYDEDTSQPD
jgi:hypothetical protein